MITFSKLFGLKSSRSSSTNSRVLGIFSEIGVPVRWGFFGGLKIGLTLRLPFRLEVGELKEVTARLKMSTKVWYQKIKGCKNSGQLSGRILAIRPMVSGSNAPSTKLSLGTR